MSTVNDVLRWKERRTLMPVWVSMGALFLFGLLIVSMTRSVGTPSIRGENYFLLFWLSSSVIGLATGIMMFVPEREQETDLLLGRLPVKSSDVSKVKLLEAFIVFITFVIVTGVLVVGSFWLRHGEILLQQIRWDLFALLVFIPVQTFLWSSLCSLWFRSSLKAVMFAAVLTAIGWVAASVGMPILLELVFSISHDNRQAVWFATGANSLLVLTLGVSVLRLSVTWLRGAHDSVPNRKVGIKNSLDSVAVTKSLSTSYSFKSLMWQGLRLNWVSLLVLAIGVVIWSSGASFFWNYQQRFRGHSDVYQIYSLLMAVCSISGSFAGLAIFRGDQAKDGVLFFQQHADFPKRVWLSRVALLGLLLPFVFIAGLLITRTMRIPESLAASSGLDHSFRILFQQTTTWNGIIVFLTAASIAQLISITCRSGMLAFFLTVAVAFLVSSWCNIVLKTGESLLIFVTPLILSCFVASWWYASRWISREKPIRSIAIPLVVVASVFVAITVGYIRYRIAVPPLDIDLSYQEAFESHDEFLNSNKKRFASVFQIKDAAAAIDFELISSELGELPVEEQGSYERWPAKLLEKCVDSNTDALAEIEEAVSHDLVYHWLSPKSLNERQSQYNLIAEPLSIQSEHFKRKQDVKKLLDSLTAEVRAAWRLNPRPSLQTARLVMKFCEWSKMDGQTVESLGSGHAKLKRLHFEIFNPSSERIQYEIYFDIRRKFRDDNPEQNFWAEVFSQGPKYWEDIREYRIKLRDFSYLARSVPAKIKEPEKFRNDSWLYRLGDSLSERQYEGAGYSEMVAIDHAIGYARIRIALQAWMMEHGSYPESLDRLTRGNVNAILDKLPTISSPSRVNLSFAYFPTGLDLMAYFPGTKAVMQTAWGREVHDYSKSIPPKQPFLLPYAGNFELRPVLIGEQGSENAEFLKAYAFIAPPNSPRANDIFLKHPPTDFFLPDVEAVKDNE